MGCAIWKGDVTRKFDFLESHVFEDDGVFFDLGGRGRVVTFDE